MGPGPSVLRGAGDSALSAPPPAWASDYSALAEQVELVEVSLPEAFERLAAFWDQSGLGEPPLRS